MDIILEGFDKYLFDYAYANLLPIPTYTPPALRSGPTDATFAVSGEPVATHIHNGYSYQPASQYISFQPTDWAYVSRWPRDHLLRQTISLYLITWYRNPHCPSR